MVYYALEVEAETAEEAECIVGEGKYMGEWDIYDADYFEIYEVREVTNAKA